MSKPYTQPGEKGADTNQASEVLQGDCLELMQSMNMSNVIIVTDPPFNIGYHYNGYHDRRPEEEYYEWLAEIFSLAPSVVVHYPEPMYKLAFQMSKFPERVVSWVYNSNTAKQHRDIAYFDIKPDFKAVGQPYKNPTDKRIAKRIADGKTARLYDWWNVNQVKNVSKDKTSHPCQMPVSIMENIIGTLPKDKIILDPFAGSGTTGVACQNLNRNFILMEQEPEYVEIIKQRLAENKAQGVLV